MREVSRKTHETRKGLRWSTGFLRIEVNISGSHAKPDWQPGWLFGFQPDRRAIVIRESGGFEFVDPATIRAVLE